MGKISIEINRLIMDAMKERDSLKTNAYKNLKSKFLEFSKAKNAPPLDDGAEINIIRKMVTELQKDADLFKQNNREDLTKEAQDEISVLSQMLPQEATPAEIRQVLNKYITDDMTMKDMGKLVKMVKEELPNAGGKMVADIVKQALMN